MSQQKQTNSPLKTRKSSVTRRPVLTLLFLLLFVGAVFGTIKLVQALNRPKDPQTTESNNKTSEKSSENTTESTTNTEKTEDKEANKTPAQYAGDNPNEKETITGVINYVEKQGNTLRIRISIDQTLSGTGTCTLKITKDAQTIYTATAATEAVAGASTCHQAFDVPAADYSGDYTINVTITADDKTGTIERKVTL